MPFAGTDARKLVFAHAPSDDPGADRVQLLAEDCFDLDKHVPVSVDGQPEFMTGTFLELRGDQDVMLYRRRLRTPMPGTFPVRQPNGDGPLTSVADVEPGEFRVVVPRRTDVLEVVLLASPDEVPPTLSVGMSPGGIQEFARFPWPNLLPNV